jgi:hypothetical protein
MYNGPTSSAAACPDPDEQQLQADAIRRNGGPPASQQTYIYFIQAGPGLPVKIGRADDPFKRRSELQTAAWMPLRIVGLLITAPGNEARLHALFADYRVSGEWFEAHPSLCALGGGEPAPALADVPFICPADRPPVFWDPVLGESDNSVRYRGGCEPRRSGRPHTSTTRTRC